MWQIRHTVYFAQDICREILEEVLPYMNIYPDEKKTGIEQRLWHHWCQKTVHSIQIIIQAKKSRMTTKDRQVSGQRCS